MARTAYRIRIAGVKQCPVTDSRLEGTDGDGHDYVAGLKRDGLQIEEEIALPQMEYESSGLTINIIERQRDHIWGKSLARVPGTTLWLDEDISHTDTSIPVVSNGTQFSPNDYIYLDAECMKVTGSTSTTITVDRGQLGTTAVNHYATDQVTGTSILTPVYDRPKTLQGHTVELYRYTESDISAAAQGTKVWRGVLVTDAKAGGTGVWTMSADPVWSKLDFQLGQRLDNADGARGIYYPDNAPLLVLVGENAGSGSPTDRVDRTRWSGFWESQEAFVADLNDYFQGGALASFTQITNVTFHAASDGRWYPKIHVGGGGPYLFDVQLRSQVDGRIEFHQYNLEDDPPVSGRSYFGQETESVEGGRTVPRGLFGGWSPEYLVQNPTAYTRKHPSGESGPFPPERFYINGSVAGQTNESVFVRTPGSDRDRHRDVLDIDANDNWVELGLFIPEAYTKESKIEFQFIKRYVTGTLDDFRDQLLTDAITEAGRGNLPMLTGDDLADWSTFGDGVGFTNVVNVARPVLGDRRYAVGAAVGLIDLLTEEFKLHGVFPGLDSNGAIRLNRLNRATLSTGADLTLDSNDILVSASWPTMERVALGAYNTVVYKTGYDIREDDYTGTTYKGRDVHAISDSGGKIQALEVEPLIPEGSLFGGATADHFQALSEAITSVFGSSYYIATLTIPESLYANALIGNTVSITSNHIPNPETGTLGITGAVGFLISRDWDPTRGTISIRVLLNGESVYGWTPSLAVTSRTVLSGSTYRLGVRTTDPVNGTINMWPSGLSIDSMYATNMPVQMYRFVNSNTAKEGDVVRLNVTGQTGTIDVAFDSGFIYSTTDPYTLEYGNSDSGLTASQKEHTYVADTNLDIDFGGSETNNARKYE